MRHQLLHASAWHKSAVYDIWAQKKGAKTFRHEMRLSAFLVTFSVNYAKTFYRIIFKFMRIIVSENGLFTCLNLRKLLNHCGNKRKNEEIVYFG